MLKDKIDQVLKTLTYREREIIKLRYGLGDGYTYTLEEVGRIFKVTRERVRQIEAKAVRKLQHPVRSRQLEGFLDGDAPLLTTRPPVARPAVFLSVLCPFVLRPLPAKGAATKTQKTRGKGQMTKRLTVFFASFVSSWRMFWRWL